MPLLRVGSGQGSGERSRQWRCLQESRVEIVEDEVVYESLDLGTDLSRFKRSPSGRGLGGCGHHHSESCN